MKSKVKTLGFGSFLATSFFGAFNDNCFKLLLTCCAMSMLPLEAQKTYVPLAGFLFALPYLVCSSYAGWISDRYRKSRVFVWSKWLELLVMGIGVILFKGGAVWLLLGVLFLMGAQSALYSPAKYGYLPETLDAAELSNGNGLTQMCTFLAIIAGTWAGGMVADVHSGKWWIGGTYCVVVAVLGIATSYFIDKTPDGNPNAVFRINPVQNHLETWKVVRRDPVLVLSLFGNTFFWYVAALFQNNLPMHVKYVLQNDAGGVIGMMLGAVGLGIGLGALVCGLLSGKRIGYHLVFPGGIMMGIVCIVAGLTGKSIAMATICSCLLGFFCGMYQLPLSTSLQKHSPASRRGSCLALANGVDCVSMILAYFTQWLLMKVLGISPAGVFIALGVIVLLYVTYLVVQAPFLFRRTRGWKC
ncbi:MAG: MFS transporter [Victivallales bacterium]|nr:MFS transporter [Victivallales bacterium]